MPEASDNERLVREMADLARVGLSDREVRSIAAHLARMREWLRILDEVDTTGVEPASHPLGRTCPHREDGAPAAPGDDAGRYFVVPGTGRLRG